MFELVSIRQQKKNQNYYWVKLSWHGLAFNWGTYRHDEHRYLPPAMLMNKRWVTTVEVPLNRQYEIVAMCQEAVSGKIFEKDDSEVPEFNESVEQNKELLTKLADTLNGAADASAKAAEETAKLRKQHLPEGSYRAKPEPAADDEGPYGLGPCLSGEEYEALSELNKAIHILNMNQKRKKYEPRLTDAGVKEAFMDNFPEREDLFWAAQEAIATCAKK